MIRRAAALALLLAACGGGPDTVVFVVLHARPTVTGVDTLRVEVQNAGASRSQDFTLPSAATFPQSFTVTASGRTGDVTILVTALGHDTTDPSLVVSRGRGRARVPLVLEERTDVEITLEPDDFVVNQGVAGAQWLSWKPQLGGRQAAVGADGSFLVSWENDCPLSRCDLIGRLFGADARPRQNGISSSPNDFVINRNPEYTESPAAAAAGAGYLIAWSGYASVPPGDIKATVLGADASHVGTEILVTGDAADDRSPVAFGLAGGGFGVAWERERTDGSIELRGRLLNSDGSLVYSEFPVSIAASGNQELPHGAGLAAGLGGGFVVVWSHADEGSSVSNVRARIFGPDTTPANTIDVPITNNAGGTVYAPHAAATGEGFVAAWLARPESGTGSLLLRRFSDRGAALGTLVKIADAAIDTGAYAAYPAVAVRASDGAIAAVWHDGGDRGDGDDFGIRLRLFHPSGLPCGPDEVVDTTTRAAQDTPGITAFGDAFLVVWSDYSQEPPDASQGAVRARVVYPTLARHDGTVGARCGGADDLACAIGLTCAPAPPSGPDLCHPTCTEWDSPCADGGMCKDGVCLFE